MRQWPAPYGHVVKEEPSLDSRTLKDVPEAHQVGVKGYVDTPEGRFFISDWSWDNLYLKGRKPNYIYVYPAPGSAGPSTRSAGGGAASQTGSDGYPSLSEADYGEMNRKADANWQAFEAKLNEPRRYYKAATVTSVTPDGIGGAVVKFQTKTSRAWADLGTLAGMTLGDRSEYDAALNAEVKRADRTGRGLREIDDSQFIRPDRRTLELKWPTAPVPVVVGQIVTIGTDSSGQVIAFQSWLNEDEGVIAVRRQDASLEVLVRLPKDAHADKPLIVVRPEFANLDPGTLFCLFWTKSMGTAVLRIKNTGADEIEDTELVAVKKKPGLPVAKVPERRIAIGEDGWKYLKNIRADDHGHNRLVPPDRFIRRF